MEIPEFYRGRCVLLTGATGFIGKAIVEKLLRCCPEVERVYVLVRPKHGVHPQERIDKMLAKPVFSGCPVEKVTAVAGDMSLPGLGLSSEDHGTIAARVSVLVHTAATINFAEPMRVAMQLNVEGAQNAMLLARSMRNLVALVHVSTAYSNCDRLEVHEEVYPTKADVHEMIRRTRENDRTLEKDTARLLGDRPNTYTFTKALAENLLSEEGTDLPLAIVRPSIVAWAWRDPSAGYVDNINGVVAPYLAISSGTLRSVHCIPDYVSDIVPVDIVVNTILAVAWQTALDRPAQADAPRDPDRAALRASAPPKVYNCVTGASNPIKWGELLEYWLPPVRENTSKHALWWPDCTMSSTPFRHQLRVAIFMLLPAFFFDLIAAPLLGVPAALLEMQLNTQRRLQIMSYFATREWHFSDANVRSLLARLSSRDRLLFPIDVTAIDWVAYVHAGVVGCKRSITKEDPNSGRRNGLYLLHKATQLLLAAAVLSLLAWLMGPLLWKLWPSSTLNFIRFALSKQ